MSCTLYGRNRLKSTKGLVLHGTTEDLVEEEEVVLDTDNADDMAVLDGTKDGLQESTDLLSHYAAYAGLKMNSDKTKTIAASKQSTQRPYTEACTLNIKVDDLWSRAMPVDSDGHF